MGNSELIVDLHGRPIETLNNFRVAVTAGHGTAVAR